VDGLFCDSSAEQLPPAVFVVGAPRVGSTLTYQLLASTLDVDFVSNVEYALYHTPALAMAMKRSFANPYQASFQSEFGFERGLWAPSEAERWWIHWFDFETRERVPEPNDVRLAHIRRAMASTFARTGRPFLGGQNNHTQYLPQLRKLWPDAIFVHIKRDPVRAAASVLRVRESLHGDTTTWFSVRPLSCQRQYPTPYDEVIAQQCTVNRRVSDFAAVDDGVITVDYDALCADPRELVVRVAERIGLPAQTEQLPRHFATRPHIGADSVHDELQAALARWHTKEGS
jgi:LPS sulfotransferase NodH